MALETPPGAASGELRKGIALRLSIAVVLVIGLVFAWQGLDRTQPQTAKRSPPSGPPAPVQPAAAVVKPQATPEPVVGGAQPNDANTENPAATDAPVMQQARGGPPDKASAESAPQTSKVAPTELTQENEAGVVVAPVLAPAETAKPKLADGPYLQVGVFTHPENAEELKAKLEAQGLPVHIASRVQVGPFKDKKEAELMREKLAAMGMASVLVRQ
jgi:DedD protein